MASEIVLPQWGMEMQDGVIVRWLKNEGDAVQEGEPLVEIETAKMQTELESTVSGVLDRIVAQEGDIVPIRGVLCVIAEPGEVTERPEVTLHLLATATGAAPSPAQSVVTATGTTRPPSTRWCQRPAAWPETTMSTWDRLEAAGPKAGYCSRTWRTLSGPERRHRRERPTAVFQWCPPPVASPGSTGLTWPRC